MNLKQFAQRAREALDERGGTDALKEDVGRARDAASTPGSIKDKALAVREALASRPDAEEDAPAADDPPPSGS